MQPAYFVGLDMGTTAVKAVAFRADGTLLASQEQAYALLQPSEGAAEQQPDDLLAAAAQCLRRLLASLGRPPEGIGLSTAMHSLLLLDGARRPCSPLFTWADTRAQAVVADFSPAQQRALLARTGTPVHPMSPLVKLRWLARERATSFSKAAYISDIKSYLVDRWTQEGLCLDTNLASASGLMDIRRLAWDEDACALAGIQPAQLPQIVAPTQQLRWQPAVASDLGTAGVPLFIGGADGCLANLGSQLAEGEVAMTIGTSAALRLTHQKPQIDPSLGLFNYHLLDKTYVMGGASNNGGNLIAWLFKLLRHPYQNIGELLAAAAEVSSDGLVFQPYLFGERAPIYQADAAAAFLHIRSHHQVPQLARAVLEGMLDNLLEIHRHIEAAAGPSRRIVASGGFVQSPYWLELFAARAGCPLVVANQPQASAYGAALVAQRGLAG